MTCYLFSDNVYPGTAATEPESALIGIDGHLISSYVKASRAEFQRKAFDEDDRVIDLGEQLVTPTFINAHTHLSMTAFRGLHTQAFGGNVVEDLYYQLESKLTPEDVRAFARFAAYESILSGTGLVWDHYYHGEALAHGLAEAGLPAVIAPTLQDIHWPGVDLIESQLTATENLDSHEWRRKGIFSALGPHATDTVSDKLWRTVVELADKRKLPIHVHVSQSPEEYARLMERDGQSPIQFLHSRGVLDTDVAKLFVHGLYASADDLTVLRDQNVVLGYCPFSQVQFGFPAHVENWTQHGLSVAIGTDCGASNDSMDVQQELRLAAGGQAFGITSSETVSRFYQSGASNAAQAVEALRVQLRTTNEAYLQPTDLLDTVWQTPGTLHPHFNCGALAIGQMANIAIWDAQHPSLWPIHDVRRTLVMNQTAAALNGLFLMGQQRGRIGDFQRSIREEEGYQESRSEAEARRRSFLTRINLSPI